MVALRPWALVLVLLGCAGKPAPLPGPAIEVDGGTWTSTSHDPPRYGHSLTSLPDGRVLTFGGFDTRTPNVQLDLAQAYEPSTGGWTGLSSFGTWWLQQAVLLPDGDVLSVGGGASEQVFTYHVDDNLWSPAQSLPGTTRYHSATLLRDGRVLVAGGIDTSDPTKGLALSHLYEPSTRTFTEVPMLGPRKDHRAVLLNNGRVLVSGGGDGVATLGTCELFDPDTNSWRQTGSHTTGIYAHQLSLLPDGTVLSTGGGGGERRTEIYNPETETWSRGPPLLFGRGYHSAVVLLTGEVMVVGGEGPPPANAAVEEVEIYDPSTQTWREAGVVVPRGQLEVELLPNGDVLALGGFNVESSNALDRYTFQRTSAAPTINVPSFEVPAGEILIVSGAYFDLGPSRAVLYDLARRTVTSTPVEQGTAHEARLQVPPHLGLGWYRLYIESGGVFGEPALLRIVPGTPVGDPCLLFPDADACKSPSAFSCAAQSAPSAYGSLALLALVALFQYRKATLNAPKR
jgi:hypothetical protein